MELVSKNINDYVPIITTIILLCSYLISFSVIPVLIYLNIIKKLSQKPNNRSSHSYSVPTLGGVAIFIGISITSALITALFGNYNELTTSITLNTALTILFFVGIKDDILEISSRKKFITQCITSLMVIGLTQTKITTFEGLLGIHNLHPLISVAFTLFVFILVINAFNLIDGIDGLASLLAIIICVCFGVFFLLNNKLADGFLSFSIIGATLAFLRSNFSQKRKIFMGDTGSMILGFLLAYQSVTTLAINQGDALPYKLNNAPIFILALLSFPLFDTLRVFIIRLKNKKSPFLADRNHLHHRLIDLGISHKKASLIIALYTVFIVSLTFLIKNLNINMQLILLTLLSTFILLIPFNIKKINGKSKLVFPFF